MIVEAILALVAGILGLIMLLSALSVLNEPGYSADDYQAYAYLAVFAVLMMLGGSIGLAVLLIVKIGA